MRRDNRGHPDDQEDRHRSIEETDTAVAAIVSILPPLFLSRTPIRRVLPIVLETLVRLSKSFASSPGDTDDLRLEKRAILLVAGSCCVAGVAWTAMYATVFGLGLTAALPAVFILVVGTALWISHVTRNHLVAVYAQIVCIIYIPACIQWSIGGLFDSGFILAWAFCGPMTALTFLSRRQSLVWLGAYLANVVVTVAANEYFSLHGQPVTDGVRMAFFLMNLSISSIVVYLFADYFVRTAVAERARANSLLLNILPSSIAKRLKQQEHSISDEFNDVSVLFADIVGFTQLSATMTPSDLLDLLNDVFSRFDRLAAKHGLEKIKTIGDAYMAVGGLPDPMTEHALATTMLAMDMLKELRELNVARGLDLSVRIGIHTGPVIAGVIGRQKFSYDVWGDTVNTASLMESYGVPDRIQISVKTYERIRDTFSCEDRRLVDVKAKGDIQTYLVCT